MLPEVFNSLQAMRDYVIVWGGRTMDPTTAIIAIVAKSIIAILLVCGGIVAILSGAWLFREGVGLSPQKTTVEVFKKVKIATSSTGAVLMLTAAVWGWLATVSFREYSFGNGVVRVANASNSILFLPTSTEVDNASAMALYREARRLNARHPNSLIAVSAVATKADGLGEAQNEIARRRAESVKDILVRAGIPSDRITTYKILDPRNGQPSAIVTEIPNAGSRDAGSRDARPLVYP